MMGRCLGMGAGFIVFALNAFVGRIGVRRGLFNDGRPHACWTLRRLGQSLD